MRIFKTTLPNNSILNTSHKEYSYVDSFRGVLKDIENNITSVDIAKAFFSSGPKWVGKLFNLRNKLVSVFGLKTSGNLVDRQQQLENFKCEPGEQLGLFKVFNKTDNEVILGEDDKHLNFRVSLFLDKSKTDKTKKDLTISTTVEFNNLFGRLYFLPVRPFHKFIVPTMLKGIIKEVENQRNLYERKKRTTKSGHCTETHNKQIIDRN
ncbi:MAG: DUF2867 domain-containing protein [Ferruginibacter sp.]|nr:DUF2867 domain-containing protein [Ferruginibacter sp.]